MQVTIYRIEQSEHGILGSVKVGQFLFCTSLERPYIDADGDGVSDRNVSSIPAGEYTCRRVNSPKFGNTFEVTGVSGRSHILFHKGNTVSDSRGCILLGSSPWKLRGNSEQMRVNNSGDTFAAWLDALHGHDEFSLSIRVLS